MFTLKSTKHQSHPADAVTRAMANSTAGSTAGMSADWRFTAKPYAHQRPSSAPPGP